MPPISATSSYILSTETNRVQSPLLALPLECRSLILQHVFGRVAVQVYNIRDTFNMNVAGQPQVSLLRVARQLYYEAEDAFADSMILFVNVDNNGIQLASSMSPGLLARLRHVQVLRVCPNTLSSMPNLQVVNIKIPSDGVTPIGHTENEIQKLRHGCTRSFDYYYYTQPSFLHTLPAGCKVYHIQPSFYIHCTACDTNFGMYATYSFHDRSTLSREYFTVRKGRRVNFDSVDEAVTNFQKRSQACNNKKRGGYVAMNTLVNNSTEDPTTSDDEASD